jgi:hypothetical protein
VDGSAHVENGCIGDDSGTRGNLHGFVAGSSRENLQPWTQQAELELAEKAAA